MKISLNDISFISIGYICEYIFQKKLSAWWLTYPSEKSWTSSVGIMTFPTEWKVIKFHGSKPPTSYVSLQFIQFTGNLHWLYIHIFPNLHWFTDNLHWLIYGLSMVNIWIIYG